MSLGGSIRALACSIAESLLAELEPRLPDKIEHLVLYYVSCLCYVFQFSYNNLSDEQIKVGQKCISRLFKTEETGDMRIDGQAAETRLILKDAHREVVYGIASGQSTTNILSTSVKEAVILAHIFDRNNTYDILTIFFPDEPKISLIPTPSSILSVKIIQERFNCYTERLKEIKSPGGIYYIKKKFPDLRKCFVEKWEERYPALDIEKFFDLDSYSHNGLGI